MFSKKILIVRLGALGDVALSMLLIQSLKDRFPCRISWLSGQIEAELLSQASDIEEIITLSHSKLLRGNFFQKFLVVVRAWLKLWNRSFDEIYLLHKDQRYKWLTFFCRKKALRTFSENDPFPLGNLFHAEQYATICQLPFQYKNSLPVLKAFHTEKKENLILLNPGGKANQDNKLNRVWPLENYVLLAEKLLEKGYNVCLVGEKAHKTLEKAFNDLPVISTIGLTDLSSFLSLLGKARCIITHDSGAFHLARLVDCPRVCLFGPTSELNFSSQKYFKELAICSPKKFQCSPCYNGKKYAKCSHKACLNSISSGMVFQNVCQFLEGIEQKSSI